MPGRRASDDPIRVADAHWRRHGWDTGEHLRAALSVYRTDEQIGQFITVSMRGYGLTRTRHEALAIVYFSRGGEMALGTIGERLLVHPTSVTAMVDALEAAGLVQRVAHPTDRRTTLARVTAAGTAAMEATCSALAHDRCGLSALDERAASRLFGLLAGVRADAGDLKRTEPTDDARSATGDPVLRAEEKWAEHGWIDGPWFRTAVSIYRTAEIVRSTNESAMRPFQLTHVRHEALAVLFFSHAGEMPMGKLSERLLVHPTSVTSTVAALERLGYVERVRHPEDRRTTLARITASGRDALHRSNDAIAESRFGLAALTPAQARSVSSILARVRATPSG